MERRRGGPSALNQRLARLWPIPYGAWLGPLAMAVFELWQLSGAAVWPGVPAGLVWLALVGTAAVILALARRRVAIHPVELLAIGVLAAAIVTDSRYSMAGGLRDLQLYLHAGEQFLAGRDVYAASAMAHYPGDLSRLPFLYPPPSLPVFGLLSQLSFPLVGGLWTAASMAAVLVSLRLFGLAWRWTLVALLWPPIEQGIFVGNIAILWLLPFALAPRLPWLLAVGPFAKPQNGIAGLWLLRERQWRQVAVGLGLATAIIGVTLPLTGIARWPEWVAGLVAYGGSQQIHPSLYGVGLARWMPGWLFLGIGLLVTLLALLGSGRRGLARLGLASVVASPSLWSHGFVVAIPAFLSLRAPWLFLVAGLLCTGEVPGPQLAMVICVASWFVPCLARPAPSGDPNEVLHPLGPDREPWAPIGNPEPRLAPAP